MIKAHPKPFYSLLICIYKGAFTQHRSREINLVAYKKRCHNNQHKQFNLSDINTRLSGTGIDIKGVLNDKLRPREKCFKTV